MTDFGRDTSCTTSLRTGRYVTGVRLVAEACFRRLTTRRGTLRGGAEEQIYGLDLAGRVGAVVTDSDLAALPGQVEVELQKDERIETVTVTMSKIEDAKRLSLKFTIAATTAAGPFTLVLAASAFDVALLELREAA